MGDSLQRGNEKVEVGKWEGLAEDSIEVDNFVGSFEFEDCEP